LSKSNSTPRGQSALFFGKGFVALRVPSPAPPTLDYSPKNYYPRKERLYTFAVSSGKRYTGVEKRRKEHLS
jgi:hypothetical protein